MTRFFAPLLCFGLAGWVYYRAGTDAVIVFVGIERIAGSDPYAQAIWTGRLLLSLGVLFLGFAAWRGRGQAVSEDES